MNLFETLDDLKPFIFRIVDNGGETYDRITVVTCDGDALLCTSGSICAHYEGIDVQCIAEDVEAGTARDLRWIDLDEGLQRRIIADLNEGYRDWFSSFQPQFLRGSVEPNGSAYRLPERVGEGVYEGNGVFFVRLEGEPEDDLGPYATIREAVLATLPEDYDLSGPEYHTTVDLWDTEGGPAPLWERKDEVPCPICEGTGEGQHGAGACSYCDGSGIVAAKDVAAIQETFEWLSQ